MARAVLLGSLAASALVMPDFALGQTPTPNSPLGRPASPLDQANSRTTSYDASYFTQFAPRTALDIARRVPGFQLDLGPAQNGLAAGLDVRGFTGTAGNVVFNGARPSSKAETLENALARIPAERVVRVEIGPGELYGSDYAGKSQVLNIILSDASGIDANFTAAAMRRYTGYINTDIQGSGLIRKGENSFNFSAGTGRNMQVEEGTDILSDELSGAPIEFRRKHTRFFSRDPFIAGSWALEKSASESYRINLRFQPSRVDAAQPNRVSPRNGPQHDDNIFQEYRDPVIEVGGDMTRPLAGGAIKLVGVATRRKRDDQDTYILRDGLIDEGGSVIGGIEQTVRARRNETIGRLTWTHDNLGGFSFEAGAEAALNTLDSRIDLFEIDEKGDRVRIDLPLDQANVNEKRGEVYVSLGRDLSPRLRVDGGANYEFSHLTVSGDTSADRRLKFFKPNLALDWKPGGSWHARFSVRRIVAQLDFYDFISVAEVSSDRINAGNENLQPQRTWAFRATAEHAILGEGVVKLDLGYDLISMLQDRVLIEDDEGNTFDAPGNIGTGRRAFATLTIDAPLANLWKGLRAKFDTTLQRTRAEDPISGEPRKFSGNFPTWQWALDVRRDAGKWSYGFNVKDSRGYTVYRTNELSTRFNGGPLATAFVEYRPTPRTAISLNVDNAFDTDARRKRIIFRPDRAEPESIFREIRERNPHTSVGLTLKQSLGGGSVKNV